MKKNNKLSELSIDELKKQKKSLSGMLIAGIVVMSILSGVFLYLIIKNQNFSLTAFVPICLLMILPGSIKLSQINAEIKSRNSQSATAQ